MSEKVYVIANFEINDAENFRNQEKGFFGILKKHGGEFITFDDTPEKIEGEDLKGRVAMWTFNSKDEFNNWYNDEEYQKLLPQTPVRSKLSKDRPHRSPFPDLRSTTFPRVRNPESGSFLAGARRYPQRS